MRERFPEIKPLFEVEGIVSRPSVKKEAGFFPVYLNKITQQIPRIVSSKSRTFFRVKCRKPIPQCVPFSIRHEFAVVNN